MRVYRDVLVVQDGQTVAQTISVFDIMEATYSGQDMGKRVITATIKWPTPIDFKIGDYVEIPMQSLNKSGNHGTVQTEKFYIYTEPQCKKTARRMSTGDAFETTVNFYPRQYELTGIMMRDFIQMEANPDQIIYSGFDTVSFYGGAHELMRRIKGCLDQQFTGAKEWNYVLADAIDEEKNNSLERYAFSFSGNTVMEALMKLNDKDFINTTFYINDRTIYVGFKRPYLCAVNALNNITDNPLSLMYGKTSNMPIDTDHGGLYDITKSVGDEVPITKLFAYGASRNLNRYYCADRIQSGRFVNKLMLPSFSDDGRTDWIISEQAAKKYGIHEGSKTFEEIYPSIRYMTYADIRGIKYCIKVKTSGLDADEWIDGKMDHENSRSHYPVGRVQCYKVTPCTGENGDGTKGVNKLVECAPPEDLAIFIHATGKTIKVILCGGATNEEALAKQKAMDGEWSDKAGYYRIPAHTWKGDDYIPGSCYCVHNWPDSQGVLPTPEERTSWFEDDAVAIDDRDSNFQRIEYVDTFWLTDLFVFEGYDQLSFKRDGYSAWAWPRYNNESGYADSLPVNEVVAVEPVVIPDTSDNLSGGRQQHWDIYLRDLGFALDEQNDFGEMVFVFSTPVVSVLDGLLAGREFTIDGGDNLNDYTERVVCAFNEDGTFNDDFLLPGDSNNGSIPERALLDGAMWRIRLNRNDQDEFLNTVGIVLPNTDIAMKAGDHIVLLDIYMPDIYIRAAEQRLLREAQAYLDKNDRGNVKYSINFDKVRFNQIPNYALQMREGVMLRVVDEDLNITSDNVQRMLVDHDIPMSSPVQLFDFVDNSETQEHTSKYAYVNQNAYGAPFSDIIVDFNSTQEKLTIKVPRLQSDAIYKQISLLRSDAFGEWYTPTLPQTYSEVDRGWQVIFDCDDELYKKLTRAYQVTVEVKENTIISKSEKVFTEDKLMPAINKDFIFFKADKYYEIVMEVADDNFDPDYKDIMLLDTSGSIDTRYIPDDYTVIFGRYVEGGFRRVTYKFHLPTSFNDAHGYYVALWYVQDGTTEYSDIRMVSVLEKDLDAEGNIANYVDFKVASVNIKINDNSRPSDTSVQYSEDENKRGRIMAGTSEAIREISAQIDEQTKASTWGTLMNEVDKQRIEQEQNKVTYEMLAQAARQNYQNLLSLKENIFDPDGTCTNVFIQTMMLQVGADSMNYQLEKTLTSPTGVASNYGVGRAAGALYDRFEVYEDDVLHHFVYTQGAENQGTWVVPGNFVANLQSVVVDGETSWPTYYVCIRCKKDSLNDLTQVAWMCSTDQYAVNQDKVPSTGAIVNEYGENVSDYWYFNWGILIADSNGHYTLQETRGNAYMYGDNIVCGKISTIAGNSFFDLTHGNFVLSKEGPDSHGEYHEGMSYIDGKLTIYGLTQEGIDRLMKQFDDSGAFSGNLWAIDEKFAFALEDRKTTMLNCILDDEFPSNRKYTLTCEITGYSPNGEYGEETGFTYFGITLTYTVNGGQEHTITSDYGDTWGTYIFDDNGKIGPWTLSVQEFIDAIRDIEGYEDSDVIKITSIRLYVEPHLNNSDAVFFYIEKGLIKRGDKEGTYSLAYKHITNALQGSTEIMGGLTMTNLLFLKDEAGRVKAGMSGLTDNNPTGEFGDGTYSEGVALFAGGTYQDALKQAQGLYGQLQQLLPVLLTKTGIHSKIGPFEVISETAVAVTKSTGEKIIIDVDNGISMMDANGDVRFELLMNDISLSDMATYRGKIYRQQESTEITSTNAMDNVTPISLDAAYLVGLLPSSGNYRLDMLNLLITVTVEGYIHPLPAWYWARTRTYLKEYMPIEYVIYLEHVSTGTKFYISGDDNTRATANIPGGLPGQDKAIPVTISPYQGTFTFNNMPAGQYRMVVKLWSNYNFAEKFGDAEHIYTFAVSSGAAELVALDGADFKGKVAIGTNGMVVAAGNSTFFSAMTNKSSGKMDIRMLGIPTSSDMDQLQQGQVYRSPDGTIKSYS